jgi:porin
MTQRALIFAAFFFSAAAWSRSAEQQAVPWTRWDLATGDWNRNRPLLEEEGLKFIATYTSQTWGNVTGGKQRGATYSGVLQFGTEIDLGQLVGWEGASFNTTWLWIYGGNATTSLTGGLFPSSGIEAPNGFRALDLWLQQKLFREVLTLRAGLFNADRDFTISQGAQLFLNSGFGWPLLYDGQLGGPPAYPFAAPGVYAALEPGGGWKFQAAAMQGEAWPPGQNPTGFYWRLDPGTGFLFLGEAQYAWDRAPATGAVKLGAILGTGEDDNVKGTGTSWGSSFLYGILDQMLWREPGASDTPPQGLALFNRTMFTGTPASQTIGMLFNAGFTWTGPFEGRDQDAAGLALLWTRLTPDEAAQLGGTNRGHEFVIEATYELQLTPWFEVQPDLQFIIQPGGSTALANALVIGLSATIDF